MRQAYKVWSGIAAGVFCLVAVTDLSGRGVTPPAGTVARSSSLPATTAAAPVGAAGGSRINVMAPEWRAFP